MCVICEDLFSNITVRLVEEGHAGRIPRGPFLWNVKAASAAFNLRDHEPGSATYCRASLLTKPSLYMMLHKGFTMFGLYISQSLLRFEELQQPLFTYLVQVFERELMTQ